MLEKLKLRIRKEQFLPTWISVIFSSVYFMRSGLHRWIKEIAPLFFGTVLDFGCGKKPYKELFSNAALYIGLDIQVSGQDHGGTDVDIFYDGEEIPFGDESIDGVVSFEVFEHLFDIDNSIKEIHRVLKPSGKILLSIPFAWGEHEKPNDFGRYTSFGITHLLEKSGFSVLKVEKTTSHFLAICQLLISYVSLYILPRNRIFYWISQVGIIFPLNVISIVVDKICPGNDNFYSNLVVFGEKNG